MKQLLLLITLLSCSITLFSQEIKNENDTTLYTVQTNSGKTYIGKILSDDGREMLIETISMGKIFLKKEDVKLITKGRISSQASPEVADTSLYVILTHRGERFVGKILSDDGKEIQLETDKLGKVYINKADVKDVIKIDDKNDIVDGEYIGFTGKDLISTRYIISTNAIPIRRGKNYAAVNLFGPEVHFAVTDRLGLGVMTTWLASPFAFTLKYTFKKFSEKESTWNYAFGSIVGTTGWLGAGQKKHPFNLGLHWLSFTYGNRQNNITFSGGYSWNDLYSNSYYSEGDYTDSDKIPAIRTPFSHGPSLGMSGIFKISDETSFILDNIAFFNTGMERTILYFPNKAAKVVNSPEYTETYLIMPGMRFERPHKRSTLQVSLIFTNKRAAPFPNFTWFYRI